MRAARSGLLGATLFAGACGGASPAAPAPVAPIERAAALPTATAPAPSLCARQHPGVGPTRAGAARQGSTVALARLGSSTLAYVADEDDNAIRTFDVDAGQERAVSPLPGSPAQVLVLADGRVAVSLRDQNRVEILEPAASAEAPLEPRCATPVAVEPVGIAVTPDERQILVTSAWGHKLTALDAGSLVPSFDVSLAREPRAVVVDDDGQRAFVAHVVGARMSVVDLADGKHEVRELDLRVSDPRAPFSRKLTGGIADRRRGGCQGFALAKSVAVTKETAPDVPLTGERPMVTGKAVTPSAKAPPRPRARIFAPMVSVDPGETSSRSSGYGGSIASLIGAEAPIVSVVDSAAERTLTKEILSDGARHQGECLLPRAAAISSSGDALFVTCLGTDALLELDTRGLDPSRLERRRWAMPSGPTGVAVDDRAPRAVIWSQFERKLAVVNLNAAPGDATRIAAASPSPAPALSAARALGRKLFHKTDDPRISSDGRACASCHPDGREDALTWSTPDGPRQTIMLAGRTRSSAPYGWMGAHADLPTHLTHTLQRLGGSGLASVPGRFDEVDALLAYVDGMRGPTLDGSVADTARQELVAQGKALFDAPAQGCADCHIQGGTDMTTHDVGSSQPVDRNAPFDTPSLRFISGTAPYFHDGRYATLDELLSGADGKMGHTLQLSRRDVQALKAYLETL